MSYLLENHQSALTHQVQRERREYLINRQNELEEPCKRLALGVSIMAGALFAKILFVAWFPALSSFAIITALAGGIGAALYVNGYALNIFMADVQATRRELETAIDFN